jgi:hypothetical protein
MIVTKQQGVLVSGNERTPLQRGPCLHCGGTEFGPFVQTKNGDIVRCRSCGELGDDAVPPTAQIHVDHLENPQAYDPRWPQ